jgi:hypothetical protein
MLLMQKYNSHIVKVASEAKQEQDDQMAEEQRLEDEKKASGEVVYSMSTRRKE